MNALIWLIAVACAFALFSCSEPPETKKVETASDYLPNNESPQDSVITYQSIDSTDLFSELDRVALSFHTWYINRVIQGDLENLHPSIIENENGQCEFYFADYFAELKELGTISQKFMDAEVERSKSCGDFLSQIDWDDYQSAEGYEYADECPQFYYLYWTKSQDEYSGVVVENREQISKSQWRVSLLMYNDFDDRVFNFDQRPLVTIDLEGDQWKITKIEWIEP